jgi:hypothetical protein
MKTRIIRRIRAQACDAAPPSRQSSQERSERSAKGPAMLSLAAFAFSLSAVAWGSRGARGGSRWAAAALGLAAAGCAVLAHGAVQGLVVTGVLAMTAASVLVLVLAPRPERAWHVAWASGLAGLVPVLLAGVSG